MIEKPPMEHDLIRSRLEAEYGLEASRIEFLPLGVDINSAVYRITAAGGGKR